LSHYKINDFFDALYDSDSIFDILDDIYKIENTILQYDTFNNLITHFYDFVIVLILKENDIINELKKAFS
jgi:hypothetical protein